MAEEETEGKATEVEILDSEMGVMVESLDGGKIIVKKPKEGLSVTT